MAVKPPKRPRDWESIRDRVHDGFTNFWTRIGWIFCFGAVGLAYYKFGLWRVPNETVFWSWIGISIFLWLGILVLILRNRVTVPVGWSYEGFREMLRRTGKNPYGFTTFDKRFFFFSICVFVGLVVYDIFTGSFFFLPLPVILFVWIVIVVVRSCFKEGNNHSWREDFNFDRKYFNGKYYSQVDRDIENVKRFWNRCLNKVLQFLSRFELK